MNVQNNSFGIKYVAPAVACLLWSTAFFVIKTGLKYSTPLSFAGMRFMLSGIMLLPLWMGSPGNLRLAGREFKIILLVSFFQTFLLYAFFYWGISMVSGALAAIVIGSSPLITALTAHFFMIDDKITLKNLFCLLMGFLGIFVIALDENMFSEPGLRQLAGIFLLLFSVISSGVGNIFISKYKNRGIDPVFLNSVQIFTGGLMLFAVSIPLEGLPRASSFPMEFYFAMGWLSFVSAAAFTIWFILLSKYRVKVSKLNFWKFIVPVAGVLFSWLFLPAEGANLKEGAGMLLVTISIILFSFSREKNVFQVKNC